MGEAKRRKELGALPREKSLEIKTLEIDKQAIQKKVRDTLYRYPIIPLFFYGVAILILLTTLFFVFKFYKLI